LAGSRWNFFFQSGRAIARMGEIIGMLVVIALAATAVFLEALFFSALTEVRDIVDLIRQRFRRA